MQRCLLEFTSSFQVVAGNAQSQAAVMVLPAGESTGGPDNRHPESDQWLYVVEGKGEATVSGEQCGLEPGVLLLIERGEPHEIRNSHNAPLRTINVYVPPAYQAEQGPTRD